VFGLLAVFIANSWLNHQAEERLRSLEANKQPVAGDTIVVAARPLRFGVELSSSVLREIIWPEGAAPAGSFRKIEQVLAGGRRVVLTAIEPNEPVLASKITGPGQRAALADVVLQNTKVLAIDQLADERTDKPSVVKAVTLEVDMTGAQKLSLAARVGSLSLALRKAGDGDPMSTRLITLADLHAIEPKAQPENAEFSTIAVTRGSTRTVYSVPRENPGASRTAETGRMPAQQ